MAPPTTVLTIIKSFIYRTNPAEEWSNTYMFSGSTPADATAWRALFDALVLEEKKLYPNGTKVIKGYAHDSVDPHADAVWSVDLRVTPNTPVVGTFAQSAEVVGGGDSASWIRWGLNRMVNGKRIYLRKYFHPAFIIASAPDVPAPNWKTAADAFGLKMRDGTFTGGRVLTDKLGTSILNHGVAPYTTTRTLKRRPKRHPT